MKQEIYMVIEDFPKYIKEKDGNEFMIILMTNLEVCKLIISNNLFWKYSSIIYTKFGSNKFFEIFKLLCINDNENKFINQEMYIIFNNCYFDISLYESIFYYIESKKIVEENYFNNLIKQILINKCNSINSEFIHFLIKSKYKKILLNDFDKIMDNYYNLLGSKQLMQQNKELYSKYVEYVNKKPDNLIYEMIINGFFIELEEVKKEKIFDTIKIIVKELLDTENLNYSDIEYLGEGGSNYVLSIGTKVLKLGKERPNFLIDNNQRFLKPLIRTQINKLNSKRVLGSIEITEKADTKNITDENVYIIYKELRDNGYYWFDCTKENIGRLIRKNSVYFNNLNPTKEAIGYKNEISEELDSGELIIIDNDYIYSEEEVKNIGMKDYYLESIKELEERYQDEKRRSR